MPKNKILLEDEIRVKAGQILGFDTANDENAIQGTGQITTLNQLGFAGYNEKPDGWDLPTNKSIPAIILETKASNIDINSTNCEEQLLKYIDIVSSKYPNVIGLLYNGNDIRIFKNKEEHCDDSHTLKSKEYYIKLFTNTKIDKEKIYSITQKINDILHFKFGMTKLQDRMILTACALVAQRYSPLFCNMKGNKWSTIRTWIHDQIKDNAEEGELYQTRKIDTLLSELKNVKVSISDNQQAIDDFIDYVCEISNLVNSDNWNGEDVMAIFFNEFNRYKSKSDAGQVFTPDHITSFMYRLIGCNSNDKILDATCGSGAFLVKAMNNMIKEVGGNDTEEAKKIKKEQLFGIELYRDVYALACANMLIHKDGRSNLAQMDSTSPEAGEWIRSKNITKVLMNPPYERKYGCMKIVTNVLDNVPKGTKCAFILPEKKLEKDNGKKLLYNHTLTTIIKMPEDLFFGVGVTTSIYVFEAGVPQILKIKENDKVVEKVQRNIATFYLEDDGLVTVKNKGRQDVHDRWQTIEDEWITKIQQLEGAEWINPLEHLSYQVPEKEFALYFEDFMKVAVDYTLFEQNISPKELGNKLANIALYGKEGENDTN